MDGACPGASTCGFPCAGAAWRLDTWGLSRSPRPFGHLHGNVSCLCHTTTSRGFPRNAAGSGPTPQASLGGEKTLRRATVCFLLRQHQEPLMKAGSVSGPTGYRAPRVSTRGPRGRRRCPFLGCTAAAPAGMTAPSAAHVRTAAGLSPVFPRLLSSADAPCTATPRNSLTPTKRDPSAEFWNDTDLSRLCILLTLMVI